MTDQDDDYRSLVMDMENAYNILLNKRGKAVYIRYMTAGIV